MALHWLDDIIELVRREGKRFAGSSPDKGAHHETAADVLATIRDADIPHDDVRARLAEHGVGALARDNAPKAEPSGSPPFAG